jgi:hypothetical protein
MYFVATRRPPSCTAVNWVRERSRSVDLNLKDNAYDELTVSRFRPFARRRFSTIRPFFVLILTRKPCVRRRRRRLGWNVRFMRLPAGCQRHPEKHAS